MSGLGTNENNVTFVKAKEGKFYLSTDKEHTKPYDNIEGLLTKIEVLTETYNNAPIEKLSMTFSTNQGIFKFSIIQGSFASGNLLSFLKNADLSKEIKLEAAADPAPDGVKINTKYFVKQNGVTLKGYFVKDSLTALPRWKETVFNGKSAKDKTDWLVALGNVVVELNTIASKNSNLPVTQAAPSQPAAAINPVITPAGTVNKAKVQPAVTQEDDSDNLPF